MFFYVVFLYALFASTFTLSKIALFYISPFLFTAIRMIIAGSCMLLWVILRKKLSIMIQRSDYFLFFILSFFHIFLAYSAEFIGLKHISSAKACLIFNLSPFITALFAYVLFNEKITVIKLIGLVLGFFAFIPLFISPFQECIDTHYLYYFSSSELWILLAVISSAFGWSLVKIVTQKKKYLLLIVNGYAMLIGGIISLFVSLIFEKNILSNIFNIEFLTSCFTVIIIGNIICYNLYGYLLNFYSTTFLSLCGAITPIWAALFGYFFLNETITLSFIFTISMIIFSLLIFYYEELKLGYIKKSQ